MNAWIATLDVPDEASLRARLGQSAVTHRIGLSTVDETGDQVRAWLRRAYAANC